MRDRAGQIARLHGKNKSRDGEHRQEDHRREQQDGHHHYGEKHPPPGGQGAEGKKQEGDQAEDHASARS
jgi:hypothetical protein